MGNAADGFATTQGGTYGKISNEQLSSLGMAADYWKQGAETQAAAMLQAAGISAGAAMRAAGIMAEAYQEGIDYQKGMWTEIKGFSTPYVNAGKKALGTLESMMAEFDDSPDAYVKSPYYDWLQKETIKAMDQSASSRGKLESGQQIKAVGEYGKNLASTDYDNWLNRYYNSLKPYQYLVDQGRAAASSLGQAGQSNANSVATLMGDKGEALGQGEMLAANATAAGITGAAGANANYLNQMGNAMISAGDIRASGYAAEQNANNQRTNSLYQLGGTIAPAVINAGYDYYKNYNSTPTPSYTGSTTNISNGNTGGSWWDSSNDYKYEATEW